MIKWCCGQLVHWSHLIPTELNAHLTLLCYRLFVHMYWLALVTIFYVCAFCFHAEDRISYKWLAKLWGIFYDHNQLMIKEVFNQLTRHRNNILVPFYILHIFYWWLESMCIWTMLISWYANLYIYICISILLILWNLIRLITKSV